MKTHIINCISKVMTMQSVPWLLVVVLLYLAAMTVLCGYGISLRASVHQFWLATLKRVSCSASHLKISCVYDTSSVQYCVGPQPSYCMLGIYGWDCPHLERAQRALSIYTHRAYFVGRLAWPFILFPRFRLRRRHTAYLGPGHRRTAPHACCPRQCHHMLPTRRVQSSQWIRWSAEDVEYSRWDGRARPTHRDQWRMAGCVRG